MRIAVLWNGLSGYLSSCLRELAALPDTHLFVSRNRSSRSTPYDESLFQFIEHSYIYDGNPEQDELLRRLKAFAPDVLIVASWNRPEYRAICRAFDGKALRVCCMDNQWRGTAKQWLGVVTAPVFVRRLFDIAFVAGDRQAEFARRLGFAEGRIWRGFLSCDHESFHSVYRSSLVDFADRKKFLYVGRLAHEKSVDVLLDAFQLYRSENAQPWDLHIAGDGPLRSRIDASAGVEYKGFVQPHELPRLFATAGCFVLPSRFEQWGVALHEAASAGLPIICTPQCGASIDLLKPGCNGLLVKKDDAADLAKAMRNIAALEPSQWKKFSDVSAELSMKFTPKRWASNVHERAANEMGLLSANR